MKPDLQPTVLISENVKLIPLEEMHMEQLYEAASDPLIWEQHPENNRWKREVFDRYFRSAMESCGAFLILDAQTGEVAGSSRYYDWDDSVAIIRIGFTFIKRKYWGGTFNRELKNLMIDYAFNFADTICFDIGIQNLRSRKAVEKLGAREQQSDKPDTCIYSIRRDEWTIHK